MPDANPDHPSREGAKRNWAAVNLIVAVLLVLAIGALGLRATLTDAAGLFFLSAIGVFALVSAGVLFHSLLRR